MAKKFNTSHRVHGLQPVRSVVIRWLGAYGRGSDLKQMALFEITPNREVSCEIIPVGKLTGMRSGVRVGLEVDQINTHLVIAFAGDAWTCDSRKRDDIGEALPKRLRQFSTDWAVAGGLFKAAHRIENGGKYIEGVISGPKYISVVVRKGSSAQAIDFANKMASLMNLPVKEVSM